MKKPFLLLSLVLLIAFNETSYGQFSFSASPGLNLNSASFGYRINNKIVPYIGFQYLKASFEITESGTHYDYDINAAAGYTDSEEVKGSIFIPNLGVKFFFLQKEKLQAYLNAGFSKPIINGKVLFDGEEQEEVNEILDNISLWGAQLAFGTEYFFDDNFSIGGEFGFSYMKFNFSNTYDDDYWNPDLGVYVDTQVDIGTKFNILPTYSKISLNFYF